MRANKHLSTSSLSPLAMTIMALLAGCASSTKPANAPLIPGPAAATTTAAPPASAPAARTEDDADTRANVSVRTKRASIGARSLPKLAELAEENSPTIQKFRNALEIARLEMENARVTFLPSLDVEAIHGLQDASPPQKDVSIRSPYNSTLNLTMTENLYDNGQNLTKLRVAEVKYERARLDFEYQRDLQLLAVAQAYFDWSALLRQREIDENNRDLLRRQFNVLEAQYKQGLKTKRDVLRIETEMRRVDMDVLRRDNDGDLAFQKLAGTVGLSRSDLIKVDLESEEPKPYVGKDVTSTELKAQDHRRARILKFLHEQSQLEARLAEREYLPQVFLNGAMGYHNHDYLGTNVTWESQQLIDWSALVTVKYNLWDSGTRRRAKEVARVKARNVSDDNRQILLDLSNDLRDIGNRLREYGENVRLSRELLVIEQQSYSILEAEYRNGRASYLDLITNLRSLIDARSRFTQNYFGLRKQQILYSFHKGELHEVLLK